MDVIIPSHDLFFLLLPCLGYIKFIFGKIKNGKTFLATKQALKVLRDGGLVISNYPIYDRKTGRSSMKWDDSLFNEPIHDALIILDEAHRMIKGLAGKDHVFYDEDKAAFFAASSHNNNEIILIAHSFSRYGPSIREAAEEFVEVRKISNPITGKALWFESRTAETEAGAKSVVWPGWIYREKTLFRLEIAQAYDYHFFAALGEEPEYQPWVVDLRRPKEKKVKLKNVINVLTDKTFIFDMLKTILEETRKGFIDIVKNKKIGNSLFYTWLGVIVFSISMVIYETLKLVV